MHRGRSLLWRAPVLFVSGAACIALGYLALAQGLSLRQPFLDHIVVPLVRPFIAPHIALAVRPERARLTGPERAEFLLFCATLLTVLGFLLDLALRGYPVSWRADIAPATRRSVMVWAIACGWRAIMLVWLIPILALAAGEALAQLAPAGRVPPFASVVLDTIGLRVPVSTDHVIRLVSLGLWCVLMVEVLVRWVRAAQGLWTLATSSHPPIDVPTHRGIIPVEEDTEGAAADRSLSSGASDRLQESPPLPSGPQRGASSPFAYESRGLTIIPPPAGWPPLPPVAATAADGEAYRRDCVSWFMSLREASAALHLVPRGPLPSEDDLRLRPSQQGTDEPVLWDALRYAGIPHETKRALYKGESRGRYTGWHNRDRNRNYYRPDTAIRVPDDHLLIDVELDGASHINNEDKDAWRDLFFHEYGWYVVRLRMTAARPQWSQYLLNDLQRLMECHHDACQAARDAGEGEQERGSISDSDDARHAR
jgi:hypothetical protein